MLQAVSLALMLQAVSLALMLQAVSLALMLQAVSLVSESGASRKKKTKGEEPLFWISDLGIEWIILTIHMPKNIFLDASSFGKV
jgi:uncharacterized membrane protein